MKVRWTIEGVPCQFAQCGLHKGLLTEIPDDELPEDEGEREEFIQQWVNDEFDRHCAISWEVESK